MSVVARLTLLTGASLLAASLGTAPARAADLLPPSPTLERYDEVVEIGTGWYLRGDVGYVDYEKPRYLGFSLSDGALLRPRGVDPTFSVGGGIGYAFTSGLRVDATVDHRFGTGINSTRPLGTYEVGYIHDRADLETTTALLNAYVDFDYGHGITPYIGVGIGVAGTRFTDISRDTYAAGALVGRSPLEAYTTYNLAWALMGGVAIDVGSGFKVDLGYRYTHLGDARTRIDGQGFGLRTDELSSHEFRVGARYTID